MSHRRVMYRPVPSIVTSGDPVAMKEPEHAEIVRVVEDDIRLDMVIAGITILGFLLNVSDRLLSQKKG